MVFGFIHGVIHRKAFWRTTEAVVGRGNPKTKGPALSIRIVARFREGHSDQHIRYKRKVAQYGEYHGVSSSVDIPRLGAFLFARARRSLFCLVSTGWLTLTDVGGPGMNTTLISLVSLSAEFLDVLFAVIVMTDSDDNT